MHQAPPHQAAAHWTEAFKSLRGQLAEQNADWSAVERALGAVDSETLLRIDQRWINDVDSALEVIPVALKAPLGAVRV